MSHSELYIGLMSGTSLDGVDVVLCSIDESSCELLTSVEHPFDEALKEDIVEAVNGATTLQKVGEIDHRLAILFAKAVQNLLEQNSIDSSTITAIGSHGQTLWHNPNGRYPHSMQLGDPSIISTVTRIPTVADFRRKDIALGGEGAPFAPSFHNFLFGNLGESVSVVNIGGMANISVLGEELIGYDTGCGNVLMDIWIYKNLSQSYDRGGEWARGGEVNFSLLESMLQDEYFSLPYPKSTGRERFNAKWLNDILEDFKDIRPQDIQRTLLELTAISISNEVLKFSRDILLLCGGGAKNTLLVERLQSLMPNIQLLIAQNADELEAMAFAWLAYKRIHLESVELCSVTGAREDGILGGVYL
ncbi:Anhydro-N-acetylmuramic acid kinase [hydrothermal vent metagenome]|uniref:Anhydro-N-acetylmuramic acid kinase n=1 Tax=hydrothermal vent metagenome TaxID=652676 RepID=A0A1W1BHN9_9ZZZZ